MKPILGLTVNNFWDLWFWRQALIRTLQGAGFEVLAVGPPGPYEEAVARLGCWVDTYPLDRRGLNPVGELRSLTGLYAIYRRWRPVIAHHFTIKPNLYGTLAARLAGVPVVIATVTGLGYIWTDDGPKARVLRAILEPIYRRVLRLADAVIYLNEEDRRTLGGRRTVLIPGEGIDLEAFSPSAVPPERQAALRSELGLGPDARVVLMVGRMLRHKGVLEFVEAARRVRAACPGAVFVLVGPSDEGNPARIPSEKLQAWESEGAVRYLGMRGDVRDLMAVADVVVLPSYREGIPRVLIEAAAMGRPLVATDVPGCREVVRNGVNGLLVPARDAVALAEAIESLLKNPKLRAEFGAASRRLAEERFSDQRVVDCILDLYRALLAEKGVQRTEGGGWMSDDG
ncbi:MAG: glycosyltransferase family 4 protein [Candidatus Caldarchaeales archaeon]|nr:glycosyltransferase family 4 protein [Candidatus Caldarchaeales archaeon]